jgi:hypothetical protein
MTNILSLVWEITVIDFLGLVIDWYVLKRQGGEK